MSLSAGTQLGPYEILASLGAGGMGEVYRARDTRLDREVAIKVLPETFAQDRDRAKRFEREAKAVAALSHPNILAIHDYGTEQGRAFAVMELLEGRNLRESIVYGHGPIHWRKAVEFGIAIADGLAAAHAKGIIHRDLKPENVFVTADGRVKILDFGLARVEGASDSGAQTGTYHPSPTETGTVMGTVGYMSPEQVRGQPVDARSDVFSLGCVLYEMLTWSPPFARATAAETQTAILREEPADLAGTRSSLPPELERVVRHCLEKNREERFQTARDLAFALRSLLTGSGPVPAASRIGSRLWFGVVAVLLLGLAGIGVLVLIRDGEPPDKPAGTSSSFESVAVLPFVNVSDDPKVEPLCDGIADHLNSSLAQVRERKLKVRPLTSTAHYKGKQVDAKTVGRELEVHAVVTGRLRQDGIKLAITLELVDARDNNLVWSKQFKGNLNEILILQDDIARDLAANLGLRLTGAEDKQLTRRYTNDPEAYLLYREGRLHWDKFTEEGLDAAIKHFQAAIKKDPKFALAYAWQAHAHNVLGHNYRPAAQHWPKGKELALEALKWDENLAEGHAGLGAVHLMYEWDWTRAERELDLARKLDPAHTTNVLYAFYLAAMGRKQESVAYHEQALKHTPLFPIANANLAMCYIWAGRYQDALAQAQRTLEIAPNFPLAHASRGRAYSSLGQFADAIIALKKGLEFSKDNAQILGFLGYAYAKAGQTRDAQEVLQQLMELSPDRPARAYGLAVVYTGLGDKDQAFHWLNQSCDNRDAFLIYLKVEPQWDSLRDDPRFDDLLRRMGMADKPAGTISLAVLPFVNTSGEPKAEGLSNGLSESLINGLAQLQRRDLKVRSFLSVSRFRGQPIDVRVVARDLNVRTVVSGSLRQEADRLFIQVELIDAQEDNILWRKDYQGRRGDILALQDAIARDVAAQLGLKLTPEEGKRLTKRYTENVEAYLQYREGRQLFVRFGEENLKTAIGCFEKALQIDASYALAHSGLADCYSVLGANYWRPKEAGPLAKKHAEKALELDDTRAEAHLSLAAVHLLFEWDWPAAEKGFLRSLELDPGWVGAHTLYGYYSMARGDFQKAEHHLRRARTSTASRALKPTTWQAFTFSPANTIGRSQNCSPYAGPIPSCSASCTCGSPTPTPRSNNTTRPWRRSGSPRLSVKAIRKRWPTSATSAAGRGSRRMRTRPSRNLRSSPSAATSRQHTLP